MAEKHEMVEPLQVHRDSAVNQPGHELRPKLINKCCLIWSHGEAHQLKMSSYVSRERDGLALVFKATRPYGIRVFRDFVNMITEDHIQDSTASCVQDYIVVHPDGQGQVTIKASNDKDSYNLQIEVIPQKVLRTKTANLPPAHEPYDINGPIFATEADSDACRSFHLDKGSMTPVTEFLDMVAFHYGFSIGNFFIALTDPKTGICQDFMDQGKYLGDYGVQADDIIRVFSIRKSGPRHYRPTPPEVAYKRHSGPALDGHPSESWDLENVSKINLTLILAFDIEDPSSSKPLAGYGDIFDSNKSYENLSAEQRIFKNTAAVNLSPSTITGHRLSATPSAPNEELVYGNSLKRMASRIFEGGSLRERFRSPTRPSILAYNPRSPNFGSRVQTDKDEKLATCPKAISMCYMIIEWSQIKEATTFLPIAILKKNFEAKQQLEREKVFQNQSFVNGPGGLIRSTPVLDFSTPIQAKTPSEVPVGLPHYPTTSSAENSINRTATLAQAPAGLCTPDRFRAPSPDRVAFWHSLIDMSPARSANTAWQLSVTPSSSTSIAGMAETLLPVPARIVRRSPGSFEIETPTRAPAARGPTRATAGSTNLPDNEKTDSDELYHSFH